MVNATQNKGYLLFSPSVVSDSFPTPWTAACHVPLSMGFTRQNYWSRLPFSSPVDLPDPGIESKYPELLTQLAKRLRAMQETLVLFLGQEDPLEKV